MNVHPRNIFFFAREKAPVIEPKSKKSGNLINLCTRGGYKDIFVNGMGQCGLVPGPIHCMHLSLYISRLTL